MKIQYVFFLSLVLLLSQSSTAFAQEKYLFKNVRIIDGTGKPEYQADMLVTGKYITAINKNIIDNDATIINLKGKTIMPSIISTHNHIGLTKGTDNSGNYYTRENILHQLKRYQDYGVSNILVMGTDRPMLYQSGLLDSIQNGLLAVPNYFSAGYGFGVPSAAPPKSMGMDYVFRPSHVSQIPAQIDSLKSIHPFLIKIWVDDFGGTTPKMAPEIYKTIIANAHANNWEVAAHVYYLNDLRQLLIDRLDVVAHSVRDSIIDDSTIEMMKYKNTVYIPTLSLDEYAYIYAKRPEWINDPFFKASLDPGVYEMITSPEYQQKLKNSPALQRNIHAFEIALQNVKKLYDAGILIALGTDSGAFPIRAQGFSEHLELELLTKAGLTPLQAIKVGTYNAANVLHIADKEGSIEKGKLANFIVLDASPSKNIKNTRKINTIWKNGVIVSHGPLH